MDLVHSPLHDRHVAHGAKFAEFGGWSMPLEFAGGGVLAEHAAVRDAVGLFDVSHLGKALVRGAGATAFVNSCLTNDLDRIAPGQAQYTLCCDDDGGTIDDIIVYLRSEFEVFLVPNAANTAAVVERLQAAAPDGVEVDRPASSARRSGRARDAERRGPRRARPARRPRVHVLRRRQGRRPRAHGLPHRLHRRARLRADRLVRGSAGRLGRPHRGRRAARPPTVRSRRARHAAHRDGLPAARPRAVGRDQPGHGRRRLGGRLGQAGVLGQGRPRRNSAPRRRCRRFAACSRRGGAFPVPA